MIRGLAILLAIALYSVAGALLWMRVRNRDAGPRPSGALAFVLGALAVALHAVPVYADMFPAGGLSLGFTSAASLVAWVVTILFLLVSLAQPVETLGVLIFPVSAATLAIAWLWPTYHAPLPYESAALFVHIVVSLLAYSLLSIAVLQSLLLAFQERQLHTKQPRGLFQALPPLQTMEGLMFKLIGVGFFLLTLTLVSGVFFSEQVFGKPLMFTHHIVLSVIAWLVFATLLFGRVKFGWRGRQAVRWAVAGFVLLGLAYFGSKFVLEVLLSR